MRILVVGSGGREHALVWKLAAERGVSEIVAAPGNPGMAPLARCRPLDPADPAAVLDLAVREQVGLTVIGPEAPLAAGVADRFAEAGRLLFGPVRRSAALEASKVFAKEFMSRHGIPTARYRVCDEPAGARAAVAGGEFGFPLVVKADGLAGGKGVLIAADRDAAWAAVDETMTARRFGAAGARIVLEEFLTGVELSCFVVTDGRTAVVLPSAQDYKRAGDDDEGPNTGGMGAVAPSPRFTPDVEARIVQDILEPTLRGLQADGLDYRGFLYAGLMLTEDGPRVIEFNVRLGDPEAQVVLPLLDGDLGPLLEAAARGDLGRHTVRPRAGARVGVVLAAGGYPGAAVLDKAITGLEQAERLPDTLVFHAGTRRTPGGLVTAGGRVLTIVGCGATQAEARTRAYAGASSVHFEGKQMRHDIGRSGVGTATPAPPGETR